jgi:hypothetical protein
MLMLMTEFIWLPCVSIECILNCKKNLFTALKIQKLMVFCKHKRSMVEINLNKTL